MDGPSIFLSKHRTLVEGKDKYLWNEDVSVSTKTQAYLNVYKILWNKEFFEKKN
jgi:hypothetical protein